MTDKHIRFGEPIETPIPVERLPDTSLLVNPNIGRRDEPFQVYVVRDAIRKAWKHVRETPGIECGGILIGHPFQTSREGITFIVIVNAIPQNSGNRSVGHFTVGPAEIAATRDFIEQRYAGYISVGWYHSHPGHGVFLSGQDMRIVRSIYNSPWHVALVIDPQRSDLAFFRGAEGERLTEWFELESKPAFVEAIALYNQAIETWRNGNIEATRSHLIKLQQKLDTTPELEHWRKTRRYRNAVNLLTQSTSPNTDISETSNLASSSLHTSEAISHPDDTLIAQLYQEARQILAQSATLEEIRKARQLFEWIQERSSGYRDVNVFIENIDYKIQEAERQRRSDYSILGLFGKILDSVQDFISLERPGPQRTRTTRPRRPADHQPTPSTPTSAEEEEQIPPL